VALSDNFKMKSLKKRARDKDAKTNKSWGDRQKIEAVQSWVLLGNVALVSRLLSIPEVTIRSWKGTEWWNNLVEEIKTAERIEMSARLKKIVDASLIAVEDRLVNGDLVFDQKTGDFRRKAVNMKDAHKVAVDLMQRRDVLDKTAISGPVEEQNDDKLLKLAEKFAAFVTDKMEKKPEVLEMVEDITDLEVKGEDNAVHEKREEGLQTGERSVQQQTGTDQETIGTDSVAEGSE